MRLAADRADIFGFRFDGKNISRFHLAPINTGYAERNIPTPKLSEFHERRSSKFIGISWVGNVAVSPEYVSNDTTAVINVGEKAWSELAERIGCLGSVPGIQLGCRYSLGPAPRKWTRGERAPYLARCREFIENLTDERIDVILSAFARGIQRAAEMGFKAVQIHAAHGYFLNLLLDPRINSRSGRFVWSGFEIVKRIEAAVANAGSIASEWRISLAPDRAVHVSDLEVMREVIGGLAAAGVGTINVSNGHYDLDKGAIYPDKPAGVIPHAAAIRGLMELYPAMNWVIGGNISEGRDWGDWDQRVGFYVGRALIADPQFVEKMIEGTGDIRACRRTSKCHFYSRGRPHIECGVNEEFGGLVE